MVSKQSDEDLGVEAEEHPDTGKWRYIYTSPGGAECLGLFKHATEEAARKEGRARARQRDKDNVT